MRIPVIVVFWLGLMLGAYGSAQAGILDKLKDEAQKKLVEEAVEKVTETEKDKEEEEKEKRKEPESPLQPRAQQKKIGDEDADEPGVPKAGRACKDLGLVWITDWDNELKTLRKLPGWADYIFTISTDGTIEEARLVDASSAGLRKLGGSKKVMKDVLDQRVIPLGESFECNETIFFHRNAEGDKTKTLNSRCEEAAEYCVRVAASD